MPEAMQETLRLTCELQPASLRAARQGFRSGGRWMQAGTAAISRNPWPAAAPDGQNRSPKKGKVTAAISFSPFTALKGAILHKIHNLLSRTSFSTCRYPLRYQSRVSV